MDLLLCAERSYWWWVTLSELLWIYTAFHVRLRECPLLGRFLSTVLPVHQFWLGACTGFRTIHYWLRLATSWACQSADVQLWTVKKLSSAEEVFAQVWKGKEFSEQIVGELGQHIQYGQGAQAAGVTTDFRGTIFNVFVCTFGQYIKGLHLE